MNTRLASVSICLQRASISTTSVTMCLMDRKLVCSALPSRHRPLRSVSSFNTTCMAQTVRMRWGFWPRCLVLRRRSGRRPASRVPHGWKAPSPCPNPAVRASLWVLTGYCRCCFNKQKLRAAIWQLRFLSIWSWREIIILKLILKSHIGTPQTSLRLSVWPPCLNQCSVHKTVCNCSRNMLWW